MRMVSAFAVFANGGRAIKPSLIDRIQDRFGKTIFKHDERSCEGCAATSWLDQPEPELVDNRDQVLDPMTAYQVTSMLEGVVQRGTAANIKDIGFPTAGKTGTTNEEKDAWFVGYTPDLVTGIFIGYDQPTPMGKGSTGGALAAPIFKDFMQKALEGKPAVDFRVPEGMTVVAIDRKTGMKAFGEGPGVIMEAFKPGTGPADSYSVIGIEDIAIGETGAQVSPSATKVIEQGGGGLF
jgi:penicillin-binding protein 1A